MRDVILTGGSADSSGASVFVGGLAWVNWNNVRFIGNLGSLWLSTNDSVFNSLYVGNSGLLSKPGVVIGGSSNKFFGAYFGGNGPKPRGAGPQVWLLGAPNNVFVGCTNDSASGHAYLFSDYQTVYSSNNQIIGGSITNPSQNLNNTYCHVLFSGHSSQNQVIGVKIDNALTGVGASGPYPLNVGAVGVIETDFAHDNLVQGCFFGLFGTEAIRPIASNKTKVLDSLGIVGRKGIVPISLGGSPFTYTNQDNVREAIYITGGIVSDISKDSNTIFTASPATVWLEPGESITVTYSRSPKMVKDLK